MAHSDVSQAHIVTVSGGGGCVYFNWQNVFLCSTASFQPVFKTMKDFKKGLLSGFPLCSLPAGALIQNPEIAPYIL